MTFFSFLHGRDETATAMVSKALPPVAVTGATVIFGFSLNEWVAIATLTYVVLQILMILRNEFTTWHQRRRARSKKWD